MVRPAVRTPVVAAFVAAMAFAAAACSSSSDNASSPPPATPTTARATNTTHPVARTTTPRSTSPATAAVAPAGNSIVGKWTADASQIYGLDTSVGSTGLQCYGPLTLSFQASGAFTFGGTADCNLGPITGTGTTRTRGHYQAGNGTLTVADVTSSGALSYAGRTVPLPPTFGKGEATYNIVGDALTITFTGPADGTVTQKYTRV